MKRGWKFFWIICGSVAGIGLILCISGAAMGATFMGVREAYASDISYRNGSIWHHDDWDDSNDYDDDYDDYDDYDDWEEYDSYDDRGGRDSYNGADTISSSEADVSNFPGIRELDLEVTYLEVIVREGDGDDVIVDASQMNSQLRDRLVYGQESGELKIETSDYSFWKQIGKTNAGKLIIQLPNGRAMEDVSLEIGAGQLTIEQINTGCLDINVGAGQAVVKKFEVKDLNVDCGAGKAKLSGAVNRKAEVDCGVGEVVMNLTGGQNDYDYELDCGIGELKVGTDSYTGLGSERRINNGTGKKMELSCGIGKVDVTFGNNL